MNILKRALCSTLLASFTLTACAQSWLTNGLVLFYPFNANANDESGHGNDGIVSGATLGTNRFGAVGNSYVFTATGSYPLWVGDVISTANTNGFPTSTNDVSASLWVKLALFGPDYHLLFANRENNQFQLGIGVFTGTNAPIEFYSGFGLTAPSLQTALLGWSLGQWYNIQLTRAANVVRIFRDGVLLAQGSVTTGNEAIPAKRVLDFGWRTLPGAGNHPLWGQLDDIRLYDRALSSNEVAQLYAIESPVPLNIRKAVYVDSPALNIGTTYQLQLSSDLNTWTNHGAAFTATNAVWRSAEYWDVDNWHQVFFRLQPE